LCIALRYPRQDCKNVTAITDLSPLGGQGGDWPDNWPRPQALGRCGVRATEFLQPNATEQVLISKQSSAEVRELTEDEVDAVNGGLVVIAIIAILIGQLLPAYEPVKQS